MTDSAYINDLTAMDYMLGYHRQGEADLYRTKWWDYRMLHPIEATEKFEEAYRHELKASRERVKSIEGSSYSRHLHYPHFLENSKQAITGMWNARRAVDAEGIPYRFYCRAAFRYAERRNYSFMPTPAQIVSTNIHVNDDLSMFDSVVEQWKEYQKKHFVCSEHKHYTNAAFTGTLSQCQHRSHILKHLTTVKNKEIAIAHYVYEKQLIQEELITKSFGSKGAALLRRAQDFVEEDEVA